MNGWFDNLSETHGWWIQDFTWESIDGFVNLLPGAPSMGIAPKHMNLTIENYMNAN